jgi:hypothetical protein
MELGDLSQEPAAIAYLRGKSMPFRTSLLLAICWALLAPSVSSAQDLGHKVLGTIGLEAGSQPEPGFYAGNRLLFYTSNQLVDRNGQRIPVTIDLSALADGIGISGVIKLPVTSAYLSASIAGPFVRVKLDSDRLEASIDRFGLGDMYVQPIKLGWRLPYLTVVTGYGIYVPTGRFEPGGRGSVGAGQWTHEISLGGSAYLGRSKTAFLSALASFDINQRKRGIDITRGTTFQVQGGAGARVLPFLDIGIIGYAQSQITDDRGADLPAVLRGARDRVFGLGPEIDATLPSIRARFTLRYAHDFGVRSRPRGQILVVALTVAVWR